MGCIWARRKTGHSRTSRVVVQSFALRPAINGGSTQLLNDCTVSTAVESPRCLTRSVFGDGTLNSTRKRWGWRCALRENTKDCRRCRRACTQLTRSIPSSASVVRTFLACVVHDACARHPMILLITLGSVCKIALNILVLCSAVSMNSYDPCLSMLGGHAGRIVSRVSYGP